MAEPEEIADRIETLLRPSNSLLQGKTVLVSAGGTREPLDSPRKISGMPLRVAASFRRAILRMLIADDLVSFGTVNLDAWALYRNSEIMMIARSAEVAALCRESGVAQAS